jgi:CHAT domain-containing protein
MEHPFLTLFRPLLGYADRAGAATYILAHPVLSSPYYTELLRGWAAGLNADDREKAERAIALKLEVFEQIRSGKLRPEPSMAILELATKVVKGRYTLAYAKQAASQPEFFVELRYPDVTMTCEAAEEVLNRDWRPVLTVMRILYAALDARGKLISENQQNMEVTVAETWLAVVRVACTDVPDGRLFRNAVTRGEAFADLQRDANPPANILHRLGTLHLDTYVAGRSSANFERQMAAWATRLYEEYGNELAGIPEEELALPPIGEALAKALTYFRRAAALRSGEALGRTLKAIAQTHAWLKMQDLPFDAEECVAAARKALSVLPLAKFPSEHAELNTILSGMSEGSRSEATNAVERAEKILARPVVDWVTLSGVIPTIDTFHQSAGEVSDADPELAVQLWAAVDDLIRERPEPVRKAHDEALLGFVGRAFAPGAPRADDTPIEGKVQAIFETAQSEGWPPRRVTYSLLRLASFSTQVDREGEGLQVLRVCSDMAERFGSDAVLERCILFLTPMLQTGHAVNALNAGDAGEAARRYVEAVSGNLAAGQPLAALDVIRRMVDLASPGRKQQSVALDALVAALAANALDLELAAGEAATNLIQSASRLAMSQLLASGRGKATVLLFLLDAAKGRRFRSALAQPGTAIDWLNHPRTQEIEEEIALLRPQAGSAVVSKDSILSANMILTANVRPAEMSGGSNPAEQLRNLQIRFDHALDLQLSTDDPGDWVPTLETLQATLDDNVVLAVQYIGTGADASLTVTTLLFTTTDSGAGIAVIPSVPYADVVMSSGEESITANMLSLTVSDLRDRIVSPPGPMSADSRALDTLERDRELYLGGPLKTKLAEYKAQGKSHLCFAPHGPLHYFPFHLLGPEDEPLAAEWCVTYLPHPYLLDRKAADAAGKTELTAIGVNFVEGNLFHLEALDDCEAEAATIAEAFAPASKLLVGQDANEVAVRHALATSRRVHLSTHGVHNVSAPSFQCIFLSPESPSAEGGTDAGGDGILNAYELLRLDLRGLDLVTFSACETALGRFDPGDNLRGIPAALLIAGVSTIVGTLWNVETQTSTFFFTRFYRLLKEQGSKKAAFRQAQAETRARFPKYRDWGAFQFIGAWS